MPPTSSNQTRFLRQWKKSQNRIRRQRLILFAGILIVWQIAAQTGLINDFIFSSPSRIFRTFVQMLCSHTLLSHIGITLGETFASFLLVTVFSLAIALLLWLRPGLARVIEPLLVMLNALPKSALAPVLIVWLGNNVKTIITAGVSVAVFGSILTLYTAFQETDKDFIRLIYTLRGNRFDALRLVILPASIPTLLSNMKVNIGLCLVGVIIGEFLAADAGLGYLIIYGSQVFKMDWVMMSIVLLCIIAMGLYQILQQIEKKLNYDKNL